MKRGISLIVGLILIGGMPLGWGTTFPEVTYQNGFPGFPESSVKGTLSTEDEGIHFATPSGRFWVIPYPALEEHRWEEKTETSPGSGLGFIAGPNPILMAASMGFTALNYALRGHATPKHTFLYILRFKDTNGTSTEVSLTLPSESAQKQLLDDVSHQLTAYQTRMREQYMRVMQQQPTSPSQLDAHETQATQTSCSP